MLEVPIELESSQLESLGNSTHDKDNQRELQYHVIVDDSPIKEHKMGRLSYSASGSRIYLKRWVYNYSIIVHYSMMLC